MLRDLWCDARVAEDSESTGSSEASEEPQRAQRRVLLLRHGEAEHNVSGDDVRDALLTSRGVRQASSWRGKIAETLGSVDLVLVSPLRRTVQTACLAFGDEAAPLELCRAAREMWWDAPANQPGSPTELRRLLGDLPRGGEVRNIERALVPGPGDPRSESESLQRLRELILSRPEPTIAVVCHCGVINQLTGESPHNCEVVECERHSHHLEVVTRYPPPCGYDRNGCTAS